MPRYDYRCEFCGATIEREFPMAEVPAEVTCECEAPAHRVFSSPAAIHFKGGGFYATDVKGTVGRRRRPNPGDDLHKGFDHGAARIADAI